MPILKLETVSFSYPSSPRPAVDRVSFEVDRGESLAIVGANGSGKSSLLRLLNGLRPATSGRVIVDSLDAADPANRRAVRAAVALVFQSPSDQLVSTTVEEDAAFGPENLGLTRDEIGRRVARSLEAVGLAGERRSPTQFLSAGQQQRLAIAGALAMDPACVAFDEATSMLDPSARDEVISIMEDLAARGVAVINVTHDMAQAARASRVLVMGEGRIVFDGPPEALFDRMAGPDSADPAFSALELPPALAAALALGLAGPAEFKAAELARALISCDREALTRGMEAGCGSLCSAGLPEAGSPREKTFSVSRVSFSYLRGSGRERRALERVSCEIPRGSLVALVGKTGSGKSSLLQLLDALAFPSEGRVISFGQDTQDRALDLRRLRTRAPLSIQRPESALFETYAGDDVAFGPRNLGLKGPELARRAKEAMDRVGLPYAEFRDRRTRELSGGEKRKLALAGVAALAPEAYLLDEPCSALDPAARRAVIALVLGFVERGATVVMATHSMEEAALADLVGVMASGRLLAFGPPGVIFYDLYDPDWGIGRPFACELAIALRDAMRHGLRENSAKDGIAIDSVVEEGAPLSRGRPHPDRPPARPFGGPLRLEDLASALGPTQCPALGPDSSPARPVTARS